MLVSVGESRVKNDDVQETMIYTHLFTFHFQLKFRKIFNIVINIGNVSYMSREKMYVGLIYIELHNSRPKLMKTHTHTYTHAYIIIN